MPVQGQMSPVEAQGELQHVPQPAQQVTDLGQEIGKRLAHAD